MPSEIPKCVIPPCPQNTIIIYPPSCSRNTLLFSPLEIQDLELPLPLEFLIVSIPPCLRNSSSMNPPCPRISKKPSVVWYGYFLELPNLILAKVHTFVNAIKCMRVNASARKTWPNGDASRCKFPTCVTCVAVWPGLITFYNSFLNINQNTRFNLLYWKVLQIVYRIITFFESYPKEMHRSQIKILPTFRI